MVTSKRSDSNRIGLQRDTLSVPNPRWLVTYPPGRKLECNATNGRERRKNNWFRPHGPVGPGGVTFGKCTLCHPGRLRDSRPWVCLRRLVNTQRYNGGANAAGGRGPEPADLRGTSHCDCDSSLKENCHASAESRVPPRVRAALGLGGRCGRTGSGRNRG